MKYLRHIVFYLVIMVMVGCFASSVFAGEALNGLHTEVVKEWLTLDGKEGMPHIVLVSGDEEYRSEEAMPQLAKILSERHGYTCTVLFAQDPEMPGIINPNNTHNIPGLELLKDADLMIIFTRFRALPDAQMKHIDDYLKSGKPVIGLRTSTHAFNFRNIDFESSYIHYGNSYQSDDAWDGGFGRAILGEKWIGHHGGHKSQSSRGIAAPGAIGHPILNGIKDGDIWGPSNVYGLRLPLPGDAKPIVLGQVIDRNGDYDENDPFFGMRPSDHVPATPVMKKNAAGEEQLVDPNNPMMPVAWVKSYQIPGGEKGKAFTTTMGSSTDLLAAGSRRMLVNAVFWCVGLEVPQKANVDLVGTYEPTPFAFYPDSYWKEKKLKIDF